MMNKDVYIVVHINVAILHFYTVSTQTLTDCYNIHLYSP